VISPIYSRRSATSRRLRPPVRVYRAHRRRADNHLARVREAAVLPWKDLTAATLAELRFNSIAGWLPGDEASALRLSFQREMNRLYAAAAEDVEM
jgi:hypothetical protein